MDDLLQTADGSKSQRAYEWIRSQIVDYHYTPGFRLVLGSIAGDLDMSVVPVREAIRRLEAEGMVTFRRNVGAHVALVDEDDYVATMQTLGVLEGAATALSAPLLTPAQNLTGGEVINQQMTRLLEDFEPEAFTRLNQQFHSVLFEPCPYPNLLELVRLAWSRLSGLRHSTFVFVPARTHDSVVEHREILELIRTRGEPLEIELATRHHRWRTMDAFRTARHPDHSSA